MESSSSDSDLGERIKNIQTTLVKSKSSHYEGDKKYAYKRKLGHLIFNANFEGGNLGHVERINKYEYDLMVRPDVANLDSRLWFNFTVSNQSPNQNGLTPVVRSRLEPNWVRLHEDQVFYHSSEDHSDRSVLSLAFRFSTYENEHQFALFYPYTYTNLVSFLNRWSVELKRKMLSNSTRFERGSVSMHKSSGFHKQFNTVTSLELRGSNIRALPLGEDATFETVHFATTILSKKIFRLSIKGTSGHRRTNVVVLCRSSGNIATVTSLVCQGLLDYILCEDRVARVARQYIDFECFPMIDPDSCYVGNCQTDLMGQTHISEKLMKANKQVYENLVKINEMINKICTENNRVILIEIRVNVDLIGSRIVATHYKDSLRMERHLALARILARFANDFYLENSLFLPMSKSSVGPFDYRRYSNVDQYGLEISPFAYYKRSLSECKLKEYDQKQYLALGKAVVYSLSELLRPKDQQDTYSAAEVLDLFHPKANDIDDLLLKSRHT